MKKIIIGILIILCIPVSHLFAQKKIELKSPNNNIVFNFQLINEIPTYNISFKGKKIVDNSVLSLVFNDGYFKNDIKITNSILNNNQIEDYHLITGKSSHVHDIFNQALIELQQIKSPFKKINIAIKAFNDGIAFRYEFPTQAGIDSLIITDEVSTFNLIGNPIVHTLMLPDYLSSHEGHYSSLNLNDIKADTLMDMPTLFELPNNIYVGITEANLLDYAGMYLIKHDGILTSQLSPWPNQTVVKVKAALPHKSPWRVLMISDRVGDLIESNILTDLSEPCKIADVSWLHPGKTTFPWWNGNVVPDTLNAPGNNFVTAQYYIDFCAKNNIDYHSVVEYGLHQWYTDDGVSFMPGPHNDVTTPVPGLDMKQICDYAKQKGVGIRVWVHWAALYPKLDKAFDQFEKWGLQGMMVDFMDRDDQQMVNIQTEILEKAAAHHLHIQFHGAYKPTGLSRTYPNEFTREGTLNYEADKWNPEGISPDHDIMMPFTRMLAGSTDYHLGGFRAVPKNDFKAQYTRPLMLGTRCHMLAMYVVLENNLQMVCDYPAAYEGQPGFEFIKAIPTTWDETKVLDAKVGEFITIARRKGNDWYVGTITNHNSRIINISTNFLKDGNYEAELFSDANDTDIHPNNLIKQTKTITNKDVIAININSGGGQVMRLIKK